MEKVNLTQLELFSQLNISRGLKKQPANFFFNFSQIWNYEKAIFIIIGFIITGIVSFSLGVKRGAQLAMKVKTQDEITEKITIQNQQRPAIEKQYIIKQPESKEYAQGYTIQVASYQTKTLAKKEAEALKKRGVTPLVLPKGNYTIICVGNFSNKSAATSLLSKLKKQYRDCFIRRL